GRVPRLEGLAGRAGPVHLRRHERDHEGDHRPLPGPVTTIQDVDRTVVQRRTVGVLSGSVALAGLGVTVGVTVGGLLARDVAGTDSAAGLGQTAGVLGAAVIAVPLARISDRFGRRTGLVTGYSVAAIGAVVTVLA